MANRILGNLRCTPTNPLAGQSVLVEALTPEGAQISDPSEIYINGVQGARQYLQWGTAGEYPVTGVTKVEGALETASASVRVTRRAWPIPGNVKNVVAVAARYPLLAMRQRTEGTASPYHLRFHARDNPAFSSNIIAWFSESAVSASLAAEVHASLRVLRYEWDFGDGTPRVTTSSGDVEHDFEPSLAPTDTHRTFHVQCAIESAGGDRYDVTRTVSVVHAYGIARRRGVIAPRVIAVTRAHHVCSHMVVSMEVFNREAEPIALSERRFHYQLGSQSITTDVERMPTITVRPGASQHIVLWVPYTSVLPSVDSFTAILTGSSVGGLRVHVEALFDVEAGFEPGLVLGPQVEALGKVNQLIDDLRRGDPGPDERALQTERLTRALTRHGAPQAVLQRLHFHAPGAGGVTLPEGATGTPPHLSPLPSPTEAGGHLPVPGPRPLPLPFPRGPRPHPREDAWPREGDECDPNNLPDELPRGWHVRPRVDADGRPATKKWHIPGRFANARRGYLVLAPGSLNGQVGGRASARDFQLN